VSADAQLRKGLGASGAAQTLLRFLGATGGTAPPVNTDIQTYVETTYFQKRPPEGRARP